MAKLMNLFLKEKINPLIGSAGVSAVPMAARVSQVEGQKADKHNFLLMHAMGTLIIALLGRNLSWRSFLQSLNDTLRISCMIMTIVAGATVFGHFLAVTTIPTEVGTWVAGLSLPSAAIIGMIICVYLFLGCLMDSLAMIMLTIPVFYPVVTTLGYDPIWFGVIIVLVAEIGVITPPVGINVYLVGGVARDVPLHTIFQGALHLLSAMVILSLLLIMFPEIALFLPGLMN